MREGEARALEVGKDITAFSFKEFLKILFLFHSFAESRGHSLVVEHRLLTAVGSCCRAQALGRMAFSSYHTQAP